MIGVIWNLLSNFMQLFNIGIILAYLLVRCIKMMYKVVEKFGPDSGAKWTDYIKWTGLHHLRRFDSVDSMLRPTFFSPGSTEDWANCVNEDYKLDLITNLEYANKVLSKYDNAEIVGVEIDVKEGYIAGDGFLGYDIIDEYCSNSLITNCGSDSHPFDRSIIKDNGLIHDLKDASRAKEQLIADPAGDSHSAACTVWAIYKVCT